jgi:hypothetical protein
MIMLDDGYRFNNYLIHRKEPSPRSTPPPDIMVLLGSDFKKKSHHTAKKPLDGTFKIYHAILRYDDGIAPNAGVFFWLDERSASAGAVDIYFQNVGD